jgi:hypothetical protein
MEGLFEIKGQENKEKKKPFLDAAGNHLGKEEMNTVTF